MCCSSKNSIGDVARPATWHWLLLNCSHWCYRSGPFIAKEKLWLLSLYCVLATMQGPRLAPRRAEHRSLQLLPRKPPNNRGYRALAPMRACTTCTARAYVHGTCTFVCLHCACCTRVLYVRGRMRLSATSLRRMRTMTAH